MKESIKCQPIEDMKDIKRLLSVPGKDGLFLAFGILTGLRDDEYRSMKWKDVMSYVYNNPIVKEEIEVYIPKQSKQQGRAVFRDILIRKTLREKLRSYFRECHQPSLDTYIFKGERGPSSKKGYMSGTAGRNIWKKWCEKLNIDTPWPSTHTGRKTFAHRFYLEHGLVKTMEILKHRDPGTTIAYLGITRKVLYDALKADIFNEDGDSLQDRVESGEIDLLKLTMEAVKASPDSWKITLKSYLELETDRESQIAEVIRNVERTGLHRAAKQLVG